MTIDEHIKTMKEQAEWNRNYAKTHCLSEERFCLETWISCIASAKNCEQIVEWLEELKQLRSMVKCSTFKDGYEQGRANVISKCAKIMSENIRCENCPISCEWGTDESCVESWKVYLKEQLKAKESKNE